MSNTVRGLLTGQENDANPALVKKWATATSDEIIADMRQLREMAPPDTGAIHPFEGAREIPILVPWSWASNRRAEIRRARLARKRRRGWA